MNEIEVIYQCPYCGAWVEHFFPAPIPKGTIGVFNCLSCNGLLVTSAENLKDSETVWEIPVSKAHYKGRDLMTEDQSLLTKKRKIKRPPAISEIELAAFRRQLTREGVIPTRWLLTKRAEVPPLSQHDVEQIRWEIQHLHLKTPPGDSRKRR